MTQLFLNADHKIYDAVTMHISEIRSEQGLSYLNSPEVRDQERQYNEVASHDRSVAARNVQLRIRDIAGKRAGSDIRKGGQRRDSMLPAKFRSLSGYTD